MNTRNSRLTSTSSLTRIAYGTALAAAIVTLAAKDVYSLPSGGTVVHGNANIQQSGNNVVVDQNSQNTIINWNSFDTDAGQGTIFNQPNNGAISFNRVTGGDPTRYYGNLSANGNVWISNPNGVVFGNSAQVNVGGLVATTADISNEDFIAGNYNFGIAGNPNGTVANYGNITIADGGLAALVAPGVENNGQIVANLGTVNLTAADTFAIDLYGDGLINFQLNDVAGRSLASVVNTGTIQADGGQILLRADIASGIVDSAINTSGTLLARTYGGNTGTILIDANSVTASGRVDASGKNAGETGGFVGFFGDVVDLVSGVFDASGDSGGGTVSVGGDYRDKESRTIATRTTVRDGAVIDVSATRNGQGGSVAVWSEGPESLTEFRGEIRGTGGAEGGDGGYASVSSFDGGLIFSGMVDVSAKNTSYANGLLWLDPGDLTIWDQESMDVDGNSYIYNGDIQAVLDTGSSVGLAASNNLFVQNAVATYGSGSLSLNAGNNLFVNAALGLYGGGSIFLNANNDINVGATVSSTYGNVEVNPVAGAFNGAAGSLLSQYGRVIVYQNAVGSVQNALDAIGSVGDFGGLVQLRDGAYAGGAAINMNRITLQGSGTSNTTLLGGVSTNGVYGADINNLTIEGGVTFNGGSGALQSTYLANGPGVTLNGTTGTLIYNNIFDVNSTAIALNNTTGSLIYANTVNSGSAGIDSSNDAGLRLLGNGIYNVASFGIQVNGGTGSMIDSNIVDNSAGTGISLENSAGSTVSNNNLTTIGGDGIFVDNGAVQLLSNSITDVVGNGYYVGLNTEGSMIDSNTLVNGQSTGYVNKSAGSLFINNYGENITGDGFNNHTPAVVSFVGNSLVNVGGDGFDSQGSAYVTDNSLQNITGTGITVTGVDGVGSNISNNVMNNVGNGIVLINQGGPITDNQGSLVLNNQVFGFQGNGIEVANSPTAYIMSNETSGNLDSNGGINYRVINSPSSLLHSNVGSNASQGIVLEGSDGTTVVVNNMYNNRGIDFTIDSSDGVQVLSNSSIGAGSTAFLLNNSTGTVMDTNTVDGAGYTGIGVSNSAGNLLVNNIISNTGGNGIDVGSTARGGIRLYGNRLNNVGGNGIYLYDAWGSEVIGNSVNGAGGNGIVIDTSDENLVVANIITASLNGIVVQNILDSSSRATFIGSNSVSAPGDVVLVINSLPGYVVDEDNTRF